MPVINGGPLYELIEREIREIRDQQFKIMGLTKRSDMLGSTPPRQVMEQMRMKRTEKLYVKKESGRYEEASDELIIGLAMTIMMERGLTSTVAKVVRDLFAIAGTEAERGYTPGIDGPPE